MHKLIFGSVGEESMSLLDWIASRRRLLQFVAAGSLFTGVDGPASAQSTSRRLLRTRRNRTAWICR